MDDVRDREASPREGLRVPARSRIPRPPRLRRPRQVRKGRRDARGRARGAGQGARRPSRRRSAPESRGCPRRRCEGACLVTGLRAFVASLVPPGLSFRDPLLLLLLVLVPLAIALRILREKRGDGALVVPTLANVAHVRPTWRVRYRFLPFALALIGYSALVVAFARPRLGLERTESWTEGVDIFIALDASGSMAAEDFAPKNRFFVAKACARQFIEGRSSDRVGLLVFAGRSRTVSPLTTDRGMVLERLQGLKLGDQGDGTAIGLALGNALARLRPSKAKSRVLVLVTDGGNNAGEIDPDTAG